MNSFTKYIFFAFILLASNKCVTKAQNVFIIEKPCESEIILKVYQYNNSEIPKNRETIKNLIYSHKLSKRTIISRDLKNESLEFVYNKNSSENKRIRLKEKEKNILLLFVLNERILTSFSVNLYALNKNIKPRTIINACSQI